MMLVKSTPYGVKDNAYTKLYLDCNGANAATVIKDRSASARTITPAGGAALSTTQKVFGPTSLYVDGSGDYVSAPHSTDWNLGTSSFTFEAWVYFATTPATGVIFSRGDDSTHYMMMEHYATSNRLILGTIIASETWGLQAYISFTPSSDVWYHIAFCRNGTTWMKIGVDGTLTDVTYAAGNASYNFPSYTAGTMQVGGSSTGGQYWNGYIDDVRITIGDCKYTDNFTPPRRSFGGGS